MNLEVFFIKLTYFKSSKLGLIVSFFMIIFHLNCDGQYLINDFDADPDSPFKNIDEKIFPILGMPIDIFHVLNAAKDKETLNKIVDVCLNVDEVYKKLSWGKSPCLSLPWKYEYISELGKPLIYWEYSSGKSDNDLGKKNTTIILGGVLADELTPVHMAFKIAQTLHDDPNSYKNARVIIAPLVNPDGFFARPFKRTNSNGVDLNRNFPTRTWENYAYKQWFHSKKQDARKFPGSFANSEQGTRFQTDLIDKFHPDRIISIHAPLAFLDLDFDYQRLFKRNTKLSEDQKKRKKSQELFLETPETTELWTLEFTQEV